MLQVSSDVFKKKEKECRKLEAELSREKQKYNEQSLAHKQALEDLQEVFYLLLLETQIRL